ncbi:ferredoxin [Patescibacteria group bacterium]|nr:ferredoxin [Patescibacteria group bacterium]
MDDNDPKVKRTIRKYTMKINRNVCIGAATCVALAPKAWKLDEEAKAIILESADQESDETLLAAAKGCPVGAITIIDNETGKQVFP